MFNTLFAEFQLRTLHADFLAFPHADLRARVARSPRLFNNRRVALPVLLDGEPLA